MSRFERAVSCHLWSQKESQVDELIGLARGMTSMTSD